MVELTDKVDIKITSKTKRKGLPVIVRVVYPGMNIADATADNFNEIYARAEQLETQEGGVLEYSFKFDSSIAGQYKILVNMPFEDEVLESSIKYVSVEAALWRTNIDNWISVADVEKERYEELKVLYSRKKQLLL